MIRCFWPNRGRSWPERYQRTVNSWMNGEKKRFGIQWDNPTVNAMGPYGPNPNAIDAGQVGEGLGENGLHYRYPMQIRAKTVQAIERHFRNWPNVHNAGVPVASNLQIAGNTPNMTATYDLTFTLILHEKIPAADGRLGGSASGGGGGGSTGGPGQGPPGFNSAKGGGPLTAGGPAGLGGSSGKMGGSAGF